MKTSAPLFTVATISYNSGKWIRQTIESVLASSFSNFEFLISDDCSTDNTWAIIKEYKDPRIKAERNENNIGEYPNRNKVLHAASGEYIFFIDGDDILFHDSLQRISKYISFFPDAGALYGVAPHQFDFVVMPYLFTPKEITGLIYLNLLPITVVGFAETIFKSSALKNMGGFKENISIGDNYVKRRLACVESILLVPLGFTFWRQTEGQATKLAARNYRSMKENYFIDIEILRSSYFPLQGNDKSIAVDNFKIRTIKLLIKNTLLKGNLISFVKIFNHFSLSFPDLIFAFKKGKYNFKLNASGANPLINKYNFTSDFSDEKNI